MAGSGVRLRPLRCDDNAAMASIIRDGIREFSVTGDGFALHDAELDDLWSAYRERAVFLVAVGSEDQVLGGGGIGPLAGADASICELRKLYCLPSTRGQGLGRALAGQLLAEARRLGYATCYLETIPQLERANRLYATLGFARLDRPLGNTGHYSCTLWYAKELS